MDDKYAKAIAKELKLIRKELEYMNGIEMTNEGHKMPRKVYNSVMGIETRSVNKSTISKGGK